MENSGLNKACFKINARGKMYFGLKSFSILLNFIKSKFIHTGSDAHYGGACVQIGRGTCTRYVQVILYRITVGRVKLIFKIIIINVSGVIKLKTFTKVC